MSFFPSKVEFGTAFRSHCVCRGAGALLLVLGLPLITQPATAFELFGRKWFGTADEETVVDPVLYSASVVVEGASPGDALSSALSASSDLIGLQEKPAAGDIGLIARGNGDFERLVATLYEDARYGGTVTILMDGVRLADLQPDHAFRRGAPVDIRITVRPGAQYRLGEVQLIDEAGVPLAADDPIRPGDIASSNRLLDVEDALLSDMRSGGYGLARLEDRKIVADSETRTLDVTMRFVRGPLTPFGDTRVIGTDSVDPEFVARMAGLKPGKTYSPDALRQAERRLRALNVFSSVVLRTDDALDETGRLPVTIETAERKHRYFGGGVTVSTDAGAGIEAYWGHRNLFGRAERLRLEASIGRISDADRLEELNWNAAALFEKPGFLGAQSKFVSAARIENTFSDAYRRLSGSLEAGLERQLTDDQTLGGSLRLEYSRVETATTEIDYLTLSAPIEYAIDRRDDPLDSSDGWRALLRITPAHEFQTATAFVKAEGEFSAYQALDRDDRLVLAGRVAAGTMMGASLAAVPLDQRFFAGGGGSVRGYAFQGIGPVDAGGAPTGGLSYAEVSAELRARVTDTIGVVGFVDGGTVSAEQVPDLGEMRFGIGAGLRYLTPFGPLRLDVAIPLDKGPNDPDVGIYAGIGQAF